MLIPYNVYAVATKLIALDDGHGMETAGKRTPTFPEGGIMKENEFNSRTVALVDVELKRCGFRTLLVAPTDKDTPLAERVKKANNAGADFYLSVHANAFMGKWGNAKGIETLTWGSGESLRVGKILHKWLLQGTKLTDRGLKDGSWLYVVKNTKMPAVLVECGFMDNLEEARLLKSEAYRQETAIELAKGLCEAFNYKYVAKSTSAPKPSTSKPSTPAKNDKLYRVQTGAFGQKANADALVKKLKSQGFSAISVLSGKLYKVQCGAFSSKANAENLQKQLKAKGYDTLIV